MIATADPPPAAGTTTVAGPMEPVRGTDLTTASNITVFGTLIWYGPLVGLATFAYAIVVVCVSTWGEIDTSLWASVVAGWQRWPIGVTGFLMISTFSRMFVLNGVSRHRLRDAAVVTMAVFTTLSGAHVTLGFLVERMIYDRNDWPQMNDAREITFGAIGYGTVLLAYTLAAAAYFVSGWLLGIAFSPDRSIVAGVATVPLAAIPVLACELIVSPVAGGAQVDALGRLAMPLWIGAPITAALIVVAVLVARRLTLGVVVR